MHTQHIYTFIQAYIQRWLAKVCASKVASASKPTNTSLTEICACPSSLLREPWSEQLRCKAPSPYPARTQKNLYTKECWKRDDAQITTRMLPAKSTQGCSMASSSHRGQGHHLLPNKRLKPCTEGRGSHLPCSPSCTQRDSRKVTSLSESFSHPIAQ